MQTEEKKVEWEWQGVVNEIFGNGTFSVFLKPYRSVSLSFDKTLNLPVTSIQKESEIRLYPGAGVYVNKGVGEDEYVFEFIVDVLLGTKFVSDN